MVTNRINKKTYFYEKKFIQKTTGKTEGGAGGAGQFFCGAAASCCCVGSSLHDASLSLLTRLLFTRRRSRSRSNRSVRVRVKIAFYVEVRQNPLLDPLVKVYGKDRFVRKHTRGPNDG